MICPVADELVSAILLAAITNPALWRSSDGILTSKRNTVKAPNIAHLSLLTSIRFDKKETNLNYFAQSNKVIIILHLHSVWNEKYFGDL